MKYPQFKVRVDCMTFNHSKYITDAMNGFTMQQTDFPYICTIVDDASTDGEQDVIRKYVEEYFDLSEEGVSYEKETEYANIIYAQHKTNNNCFFAALFLKENHYSQKKDKSPYLKEWHDLVDYTAFCEGDDYWIDENKLQRQVVFLDNNQDYGIAFEKAKMYYQEKGVFSREALGYKINDYKDIILKGDKIPTASVILRKRLLDSYSQQKFPKWAMGDCPLWIYASHESKIHFEDMVSSVYRILQNSATCRGNYEGSCAFIKSGLEMYLYFNKLYGLNFEEAIRQGTYDLLQYFSFISHKYDDYIYYYRLLLKRNKKQKVKFWIARTMSLLNRIQLHFIGVPIELLFDRIYKKKLYR